MGRWLIITGTLLIILGLAWPWISKFGFGRMPGDIHFEREGFSFHFPLMTSIVVSIVISVLIWIFRR